jgi:hypothetical protein
MFNRKLALSISVLFPVQVITAAIGNSFVQSFLDGDPDRTSLTFGVYLLTRLQAVPDHLLWVYILAGTAGMILSYLLFTSKLVPRPIAALASSAIQCYYSVYRSTSLA